MEARMQRTAQSTSFKGNTAIYIIDLNHYTTHCMNPMRCVICNYSKACRWQILMNEYFWKKWLEMSWVQAVFLVTPFPPQTKGADRQMGPIFDGGFSDHWLQRNVPRLQFKKKLRFQIPWQWALQHCLSQRERETPWGPPLFFTYQISTLRPAALSKAFQYNPCPPTAITSASINNPAESKKHVSLTGRDTLSITKTSKFCILWCCAFYFQLGQCFSVVLCVLLVLVCNRGHWNRGHPF